MDAPFPILSFPDVEASTAYLSRLPLANPAVAEQQIVQFLDSVLAAPPKGGDLLGLLEALRAPLAFVEEERARACHSKPLVLGDPEEKRFQQVVSVWRKAAAAYALCLEGEGAVTGDPERTAIVLQRCLHCLGMVILEHYRVRREQPAGLWSELHRHHRRAEELGVATVLIQDDLDEGNGATHCTAAWAAWLLLDLASPYSHSLRDINLMRRWAARWAPLVSVHALEGTPPYLVDLSQDASLRPAGKNHTATADQRCLDTSRLSREVSHAIGQLRNKVLPSQLGLGEEISAHVIGLLGQLARPWSQSAVNRKFRRFAAAGVARVCVGFEAIHFCVSGRPFEQPETSRTYSRSEFNTLYSFRELAVPGQRPMIRDQAEGQVDSWEVINHSANGFRLARTSAGQKMSHGQLMALCPHDGERFLLAQISWLMQDREGGLVAGVSVLPGLPTGVAVRIMVEGKDNGHPFVRGFLMSPVPNVAENGSLVLPVGTYQASRVYEIYAEGYRRVRVKNILQRGIDFDRVSFEIV